MSKVIQFPQGVATAPDRSTFKCRCGQDLTITEAPSICPECGVTAFRFGISIPSRTRGIPERSKTCPYVPMHLRPDVEPQSPDQNSCSECKNLRSPAIKCECGQDMIVESTPYITCPRCGCVYRTTTTLKEVTTQNLIMIRGPMTPGDGCMCPGCNGSRRIDRWHNYECKCGNKLCGKYNNEMIICRKCSEGSIITFVAGSKPSVVCYPESHRVY
jgi:hypothetical protein